MRRIDGARLLNEIPEVAEKIKDGSINLTQINQVQRAIREVKKQKQIKVTTQEKIELLSQLENVPQKQFEVIILQALEINTVPHKEQVLHRNKSVSLTMTFTKEQMEVLSQIKSATSHAIPNGDWADLFHYLAEKEIKKRKKLALKNQ